MAFMVWFLSFSPQGGLDGDSKDDLDSGDENEGRKLDTEDVRYLIIEDIPIGIQILVNPHFFIQDYHTDALMGRAGSVGSVGKASAAAAAFGHYGSSAGGVPGSAANASAAALAALPSSMDSLINPALNPYAAAAAVKNPYGSHYGSVTGSHQVLYPAE